jgi:hypothetical protein
MKQKPNANSKVKKGRPKIKLGVPDLEMSKAAVLRSLGSPDSRRGYQGTRTDENDPNEGLSGFLLPPCTLKKIWDFHHVYRSSRTG